MKNYLLVLVLSLSFNCFSQVPKGFWATAGGNYSTLSSDYLKSDSGVGYSLGVAFTIGYNESFNYEIQLAYNRNAFSLFKTDLVGLNAEATNFSRGSLDLSFNFNYYLLKPDENKFYLGPQVGLAVFYYEKIQPKEEGGFNSSFYQPLLIPESSIINDSMEGFKLGASFGFVAGYNKIRLALKYNLGLGNYLSGIKTNSFDASNKYTGPEVEGKLNNISLSLFYSL